jgi:glycolate oxidase iron-sulfur subunit
MFAFDSIDAPRRDLIDKCVHCGFCLPSCPTYLLWGEEMDSPRGRIYLMKAAIDERMPLSDAFVSHFDACLGCMACVTACPSGVQYGPLIERTRAQIERRHERSFADRLFRTALFAVVPYPARLRLVLAPLAMLGGLVSAFGRSRLARALPERLRALVALAPRVTWSSIFSRVPERTPAAGTVRLRVGLLTGCVQRLVFPDVNDATISVLAAEGCEVTAFARRLIECFEAIGAERIVVNAAGCGSSMKEYGELLADDPAWASRAHAFAERVRDVTEVLAELGDPRAPRHPIRGTVAYHDACHLAHAQGVRSQPRDALRTIPGLEIVSAAEADICCGSAGIYNLVQPDAARDLGTRKVHHIAALRPDFVATGNPGCMMQIASIARREGHQWRVIHPIQLIAASIRGE